jgi:hypothetical protein
MAQHIQSVETSGIRQVTKEQFYRELQWGDMVFCSGQAAISKAIEGLTGSPWSHVLMAWLPFPEGPWLTLEATIDKGVHVGLLSDYTNGGDGPIVLARRTLTEEQKAEQMVVGLGLVDDKYDWKQEVTTAAHKLLRCLPVVQPNGELYCSGLEYVQAATVAPYAYKMDAEHPNLPAPEDIYVDPSVEAICALIT